MVTSADEVRAIFNSTILPAVAEGRVRFRVLDETEPSERSNQPRGTVSQTLGYFVGDQMVARAHRFLLKDESVSASGLPDPKWVVFEGTILIAE